MTALREPLTPGSTLGILGGGQLGRMLAMAAADLGFDVVIFTPEDDAPAARVAARTIVADYSDEAALRTFAKACAVVTLEFENVPVLALELIAAAGVPVRPGPQALRISQDRFAEKTFLTELGLKTARFEPIDGPGDLEQALIAFGGPGVLKTRREGYDGKGQAWLTSPDKAQDAWDALGDVPCILEAAIKFEREISVLVARGQGGETTSWAPPHNTHAQGILARSVVPSGLSKKVEDEARQQAVTLAGALDYVGVLALEFFVLADGTLIANEFAPRVHNSGHWTPEACETGQFEQHIRAVAGWPLTATRRLFDAEMINLIGEDGAVDVARLAPGDKLTLYGKRDARPGRKMGHIVRRLKARTD
jgi:5-(carboxyamino)imidazole ribonucleotide synthase